MPKDTPFRICVTVLLMIQAVCWILTLVDLLNPGRRLSVYQQSSELFSYQFSQLSSTFLHRGVRVRLASFL
ncbi:hypothetical protein EJ04DRAFT_516939 [Polyplosphaeria fusca]|uniref:Uncharacterized protein n=1 Tax=Polyplosphaeria fusca TaxID=682080 RepID=A0A9P4QIH8_9PLEO|nr:hypothetical protein EJ04DRAFT_516939 [Polyplosphaeria fusca]